MSGRKECVVHLPFGRTALHQNNRRKEDDLPFIAVYRNSDSLLIGTYEYDFWEDPVSVKEAAAGLSTGAAAATGVGIVVCGAVTLHNIYRCKDSWCSC